MPEALHTSRGKPIHHQNKPQSVRTENPIINTNNFMLTLELDSTGVGDTELLLQVATGVRTVDIYDTGLPIRLSQPFLHSVVFGILTMLKTALQPQYSPAHPPERKHSDGTIVMWILFVGMGVSTVCIPIISNRLN